RDHVGRDCEYVHDVRHGLIPELAAALAAAEDVAEVNEELRGAVNVVVVDLLLEDRDFRVPVRHITRGGENDRGIRERGCVRAAAGDGARRREKHDAAGQQMAEGRGDAGPMTESGTEGRSDAGHRARIHRELSHSSAEKRGRSLPSAVQTIPPRRSGETRIVGY